MLHRNIPPITIAIVGVTLAVALLTLVSQRPDAGIPPGCLHDVNAVGSIVPLCEVFNPIADTYIDQTDRQRRFDSSTELRAGGSSQLVSHVQFDASRIGGDVKRASLWLYAQASADGEFEVYRSPGGENTELTIPAALAPDVSVPKSTFTVRNAGWTVVDVTPLLVDATAVSLALTSPSTNSLRFGSSESGETAPRLVVEIDPVLIVAGDIAHCVWNRRGAEVTGKMLNDLRGTIAILGDVAYDNGSPGEFEECFEPVWGPHKARIRPALGNHDYGLGKATGYFDYFGDVAGDPDRGYYSYNLGAWRVIVINSNCRFIGGCGPGSPQERWLRDDLANNPTQCTVAYWHHALFTSGIEGSSPIMEAIWQALFEANVDLILSAHAHSYERFAPQSPDGRLDLERGIRQFVVGTGGAPLAPFISVLPNSEVRQTDLNGLLKLKLRAGGYDWEFISEPGKTFQDSGSATCH